MNNFYHELVSGNQGSWETARRQSAEVKVLSVLLEELLLILFSHVELKNAEILVTCDMITSSRYNLVVQSQINYKHAKYTIVFYNCYIFSNILRRCTLTTLHLNCAEMGKFTPEFVLGQELTLMIKNYQLPINQKLHILMTLYKNQMKHRACVRGKFSSLWRYGRPRKTIKLLLICVAITNEICNSFCSIINLRS